MAKDGPYSALVWGANRSQIPKISKSYWTAHNTFPYNPSSTLAKRDSKTTNQQTPTTTPKQSLDTFYTQTTHIQQHNIPDFIRAVGYTLNSEGRLARDPIYM
jgi:hypothetical protein